MHHKYQRAGWETLILNAFIKSSMQMVINASPCPQHTKQDFYSGSNPDLWFPFKNFCPESWRPKAVHYERFLCQLTQTSDHNGDWFSLIDSCTPFPSALSNNSTVKAMREESTLTHNSQVQRWEGACLLPCLEQNQIIYGPFRCKCIIHLANTLHMQTI